MASSSRLCPPTDPLNFIRVIRSYNIQSKAIMIPERFLEKNGKSLLSRVILKTPDGLVWLVDLMKSKGEIWLKNGWLEFAEHYGLEYGHLLLFKYEGYSIFNVIIFEKSALEIVYPTKKNRFARERERIGEDDSTRRKAGTSPDSSKDVNVSGLKTVKSEEETSWSSDQEVGGECSRKRQRKQGRCDDGRSRALEAAKANFKSDKPFFMVYMPPSCVSGRAGLHLHPRFVEKYWSGYKKHSKCLLQVADDESNKTWEAVANNASLGYAGWKMFVKDNEVSVGDVCIFELIDKNQNLLRVTIHRAAP